jgi:hypothetical protein
VGEAAAPRAGGLPIQQREDGGGVGEIGEHGGGLVRAKFIYGVAARRDRDRVGADHLAALDIVRRVADDPHAIGGEFDGVMHAGAAHGVRAEVVAAFAVVGEGAEGEMFPQAVAAQFDFGSAAKIARQQALGDVGARGERREQLAHAGEGAGVGMADFMRKRVEVAAEIAGDVFRGIGQGKFREDAPGDPWVGASGEFDALERADDAKLLMKRGDQRAFARAAGVDQRAIDIPKQQRLRRVTGDERQASARAASLFRFAEPGPRVSVQSKPSIQLPMKTFFSFFTLIAGLAVLTGCSTTESRIAKQPELFNRLTPEQQQMIREGRVGMGFDMDMVKLALGEPDRVRERIDQSGRSEVWTYLTYEAPNGVLLYRGWYHRGWANPYYPYYLDVPGRRERSRDEVVFRDGRVVSVEQERR